MKFNLFEGARRIALVAAGLWIAGFVAYAILNEPHTRLTYKIERPTAAPLRIEHDCGPGDLVEYGPLSDSPTFKLCFVARLSDGRYMINFKEQDGYVLSHTRGEPAVQAYAKAYTASFRPTLGRRQGRRRSQVAGKAGAVEEHHALRSDRAGTRVDRDGSDGVDHAGLLGNSSRNGLQADQLGPPPSLRDEEPTAWSRLGTHGRRRLPARQSLRQLTERLPRSFLPPDVFREPPIQPRYRIVSTIHPLPATSRVAQPVARRPRAVRCFDTHRRVWRP